MVKSANVCKKSDVSLKSANVFVFRKKQRHPVAKHPISTLLVVYTSIYIYTILFLLLYNIFLYKRKYKNKKQIILIFSLFFTVSLFQNFNRF